ncbi:hypothetical protein [Psychrobacillus sp. FSL K6-1464]|uniref:hypothetical protein n=1 Tax=Psychrobacillus sp. FSL K6-1464 TaxID=2921545 RepID=UPI0030FB1A80
MSKLEEEDLLHILASNLSKESRILLASLVDREETMSKEELKKAANELYELNFPERFMETGPLIHSRHSLDMNTARLEGAGLVHVKEVGRVRIYSVSDLGHRLADFINKD